MTDPIQEIIEELILTAPLDDIPAEEDRVSAAKQIRHQIGKELLEHPLYLEYLQGSPATPLIEMICQLEDE